MNRSLPKIRDLLAAEYVIGTLRGPARDRFEAWLREDAKLEASVRAWERRFDLYNDALAPLPPPGRVWRAIEARIANDRRARIATDRRVGFWRGLAIAAVIAFLIVLATLLQPRWPIAPDYVAVIVNDKGGPMWLVQADVHRREVLLKALQSASPAPTGKSYELWLLPGAGAPVSMGLLPSAAQVTVALRDADRVATAKGLAVSLEPAGGSPTGGPTGPVVYQAALVQSF